jgi:uncharacterized membrane protein YozB (DUF420 family)
MLVGFVFARRKLFRPYHKWTMTAITLVNWLIIIFLMARRYSWWALPYLGDGGLQDPRHLIPSVHLVFGGLAQLLATYLVILMWTERTRFAGIVPKPLRITNIKPFMRTTLALWLVTAFLGIGTYLSWYPFGGMAVGAEATPAVTEQAPQPGATDEAADPYAAPSATEEADDPYAAPSATEESE